MVYGLWLWYIMHGLPLLEWILGIGYWVLDNGRISYGMDEWTNACVGSMNDRYRLSRVRGLVR